MVINMGYAEQGRKINALLKEGFAAQDKEKIINAFIWAGQVAKFRCRQNTAYENFMKIVLDGIVEVDYVPFDDGESGRTFDILRVTKNL